MDIEQFRADMQKCVPESVQQARERKLRELQQKDSAARLKPLDPGPRTTNKCLGMMQVVRERRICFYVASWRCIGNALASNGPAPVVALEIATRTATDPDGVT
jgi:hypothetical protein